MGNTAKHAGWDSFKTPILQEFLGIQNLFLEEHHAFLEVINLFQQLRVCKKQTSISHSSAEPEIILLDAGLWDLIVLVLGNTTQNHGMGKPVVGRDASEPGHHRVVESTLLRMGR